MSWITRLKNTFNSRRLEQDLSEEMRDHIERSAGDLQGKGVTREEAERLAALRFGNQTGLREQSRDVKIWTGLEDTLLDIRYAWRGLRRDPVFAVTAVISLGLAIGANTAIYSIVDAAVLRRLPVPDPDALFTLAAPEARQPGTPDAGDGDVFSYPLYQELRTTASTSGRIALFGSPNRIEAQVEHAGAAYEDVIAQFVSPDAFDILGIPPALGRLLSPNEDHFPSPRRVAVLSYDYWRRRFGANSSILGRTLLLEGRTYSVIGVARDGFTGTEPGKFVDAWIPITLTDPDIFTNPEFRSFHLLGRLSPDVTREQLVARLQTSFHRHQEARVARGNGMSPAMRQQLGDAKIVVYPGGNGVSAFRRNFSRPLWILMGVAGCILLIACANVASLLLARATARSGEIALRVALGARRVRLVRQLLTESLLISLLAGICGWVLARVAAPVLVAMVSKKGDPIRLDMPVDSHMLFFSVTVCGLSALLFGLLPAYQASGTAPVFALRRIGQTNRLRVGRLFVAAQVAFAFCLVTGGAGFLFSLRNLSSVDTGFDPKDVTVLRMTDDAGPQQRALQLSLMQQMQVRTAALPTVQGAATGWMAIFSGGRRADRVIVPGKQPSETDETFYRISPGYFAALHTPILGGRDLNLNDNDNEPVPTVVNRAFARRYFGDESVLGREFRRADGTRHQIVGLAANSHYGDLHGGPEPIVYIPMKPNKAFTLYVRSALDATSVGKMVEREAAELGSGLRVVDVTTLNALVGGTILKEKLLAGIGGAFALLGLVLAAIGIFGLLNYSVSRRTREIGIRSALGARRGELCLLVFKDLMGMIAGGLLVGIGASLALMRLAGSLMFGIGVADPLVFGTAIAVFLAAVLVAGGFPAYRATVIDPTVALRHD